MHHVLILKAAHHVNQRVHLANVGQELVAQPLAPARAAHQAGDVDKFDGRGGVFLRAVHPREHVKARVGHRHDAGVGLYGAKG